MRNFIGSACARDQVVCGGLAIEPGAFVAFQANHGCIDQAGRDDVDAPGGKFRRDAARKSFHCTANGPDGDLTRAGLARRGAGDQHDTAVFGQVFGAIANHVGITPHLVKRALETVHVHAQERADCAVTARGGADQHVKGSKLFKQRLKRLAVAHIALFQGDARARITSLAGVTADRDDFATKCRQLPGCCQADTRRAAEQHNFLT